MSGPPIGTEAIGAGRCCGKIVWVVVMYGSWASPRNPEGKNKKTNLQYVQRRKTSAHMPSAFRMGQHMGRPVARPVKPTGRGRADTLENLIGRSGPGR